MRQLQGYRKAKEKETKKKEKENEHNVKKYTNIKQHKTK